MTDAVPILDRQPLNDATMRDITAQQVIPGVLDIPEMQVKMLAHDRGYDMLTREPLSQDEVEGDHRQLADMPEKQAIELALGEIE